MLEGDYTDAEKMLHQKNKESLQDKQLKDKNRSISKRESEREMLRKKQQNMQVDSYEPESDVTEAASPADANKDKMLQKKQLMLNRQKLQLQTKAVNSGNKTDMHIRKESKSLSKFLEGRECDDKLTTPKSKKKSKIKDVEIMPEVDVAKGVKEGYAPGDVDQKVGAVTAIPKKDQDDAKARILAKAKAKRDKMKEETEDSLKDRRMERGGVDGNNRYNKPVSNTPNTFGKKKPKYDGMSALEKVKASIRAKHGQGAIIDTKKKS